MNREVGMVAFLESLAASKQEGEGGEPIPKKPV
jgi:hypothetical protein